jgi:hypothetical protein
VKAYTSRERFDERQRFTGVRERMGQVRLDSEANEQATLVRTDARRRSGDVAEGSPDDGFRVTDTHLLDPVKSTDGWSAEGLPPGDERVIRPELRLARRDPDTLPHVVRSRGHTKVVRRLDAPVDLLRLPVPLHPQGATYQAAAIVVQARFLQPPTDDELVDVHVVVLDRDGAEHDVAGIAELPEELTRISVPLADLAGLRAGAGAEQTLVITGWGMRGLPPRAEVDFDALLATDASLGESDFVLRGGDGTLAGAGRIYAGGMRSFIERDWRYSLQPDLPDPVPLARPQGAQPPHHLVYIDIWERPVHAFQDPSLRELALGGEDTAFRGRKVTQVRVREVAEGQPETLRAPVGAGRLTTNVPAGALPDRFPVEDPDPCRDRCLFTENLSTGEGYRGQHNVHVRVEVLSTDLARPVIGWSRDNAATVAPLLSEALAGAQVVRVDPEDAKRFVAGDLVVVEDERSRLDPEREAHRAALRRLRAVNAATGELELEAAGHLLASQPDPLDVGGGLERAFAPASAAAVRRWDGADWLLAGVRYNLDDGITFALSGDDFRVAEHWSFTARVASPDGAAHGVVEQLTDAPVHGPWHQRVAIGRVVWTETGRELVDLRARFLPLHEVRDRLIELGRRHLSPGAFTVVVGDGERTFGDVDQDLEEGVTGDEALQVALDRLRPEGGTVYLRAGTYRLEHPVLVRSRSRVRILGDGDATELRVTGTGGAFYLDWCGYDGEVSVELLRLVESPEEETPIGTETPAPELPGGPAPGPGVRPLVLGDLTTAVPVAPDLISGLAERLRSLRPFEGRAAESVVATIARLRQLQRQHPGQPLEQVAPEQLAVLRRLPHGVVTIADSRRVRLAGLTVSSREHGQEAGIVAAGVLVAGSCAEIAVSRCRIEAPSGVVAAPYGRSLTPTALVLWPRSGLFLSGLVVAGNDLRAIGDASFGVRVADGVVDGLVVEGNRIEGFPWGVALEDRAETRAGEPVDRSAVRDNLVAGSRSVGILVSGDGVDVDANEVRVAADRASFCAAIQVTGAANRVRNCWVTLPDEVTRPALGLEAGILVGSGVDRPDLVGRPVHDVEVTGNRIEGAGGVASGILVGGSQPIFDVRIRENTVRNLGDAGIRAWGHGGSVGGLRIEENQIEGVARGYLLWGQQAVAELAELTSGLALPAQGTPRDLLEVLLAQPTGVTGALDAMLRWLERATLRGGVVLSLVEESQVRGNRIVDVGTKTLPAGFASPGADARTAGVAVAGGRDLVVEGNRVQRVQAPVQVVVDGIGPVGPPRPPIFDVLRTMGVLSAAPGRGIGRNVLGAAVALRRDVLEYATGNARARQRLGGRVYGALEALAAALEPGGPEGRRLALELSGGISEMLEAQGTEDHTRSANHVRATLSQVASFAADDEAVAQAWAAAASFDSALLGADDKVIAAATTVAQTAGDLSDGLDALELGLAGRAQEVIAGGGSASARSRTRLALAQALGTMAEGRARKVEAERSVGSSGLAGTDRTIAEGIVRLSLDALAVDDPVHLNEQAVASVQQGSSALAEVLQRLHPTLADRVRHDVDLLRRSPGRPSADDVQRLVGTLHAVQGFARGEQPSTDVRAVDVEAQQGRFHAELVTVTADQLERRVAGLALDTDSAAARNLRLLGQSAGQLVNLVSGDAPLAARARLVREAVGQALVDVDNRAEHQARARQLLREIQDEQVRKSGVAGSATPAPETQAGSAEHTEQRLAALSELLLELRDTDEAAVRAEGASLFEDGIRQAIDAAGARGSERESLLSAIPGATSLVASGASPEAAAAALHTLAGVLERVSYRATQRPDASAEARAVHVLNSSVTRALEPEVSEPDRLGALSRWVSSNREVLSASATSSVANAATTAAALSAIRASLAGLTLVRPLRPPIFDRVRVQAHDADGAYLAGVQRSLELRGNVLEDARSGGTVAGQADHVLAPVPGLDPDPPALSLRVDGNQVAGGAIGALDLRPDGGAVVSLSDNEVTGCAGAGPSPVPQRGQAVVQVSGRGDLLVAGNRLRDNGNRRSGGQVHELLLDWRGDVTVRDNLIRHGGGQAGGAAAVIITGPVAADRVQALASQPALVVEPAPPPILLDPGIGSGSLSDLNDMLAAGLGGGAGLLHRDSTFGVGGFRLATRELRPSYALLDAEPAAPLPVDLAQARADTWAQGAVLDRFDPLLAFLRRLPPVPVVVPPAARHAVHVSGNDVVASGPALLLLAEGPDLVSATVVGNELESLAATGAVYLREVDTTVLASNRCQCLREVNVVVVRCRRSLVSVMGNVAAGAEPPTPPRPPFVPLRPELKDLGDLHLAVQVGSQAALTLKLDQQALLGAIEASKNSSFQRVATDAEASFNLFAKQQRLVVEPDVANILSLGAPQALFRLRVGPAGPLIERPLGAAPAPGGPRLAGDGPIDPGGDNPGPANPAGANPGPGDSAATVSEELVERAVKASNTILANQSLSGAAKLFGMAVSSGLASHQARALVQSELARAGGDHGAALASGLASLTGIGEAGPTVTERIDQANPVEDIIALLLRNRRFTPVEPLHILPLPLPPSARSHSLVIIGGSRVGAVSNVTTSGVHVHNAAHSIENNV